MSTLKIGIIANCQSQSLSKLMHIMLPEAKVSALDLSSPQTHNEEFREKTCAKMSDCDYVFIQPHHLTFSNEKDMRELCQGQIVRIANFFFRGLHPDMCMLGDFDNRIESFSRNHSIVILDAFIRGLSAQEASQEFNLDNYNRLGLFKAWELSVSEMRARDDLVDFPVTELVEESARAYPAFLTMNHPSIRLVNDYLTTVLNNLAISHNKVDIVKIEDPMDVHDIVGVLDIVCDYYHLPYRTSEHWRINDFRRRYLKLSELAEEFFRVYEKYPADKLRVHSPQDMIWALRQSHLPYDLTDENIDVKDPVIRNRYEAADRSVVPLGKDVLRKTLSHMGFVDALDIKISTAEIMSCDHENFAQVLELINKFDQFNTTGKRWTREDSKQYFENKNGFYVFKVKDRFANYGIVGCAMISLNVIDQFVMSYSVFGMDVENKIMESIAKQMKKAGATQMFGVLIKTERNFSCHALYDKCGFAEVDARWVRSL